MGKSKRLAIWLTTIKERNITRIDKYLMKVTLQIITHNPNSIEKIELEDVASYEVTDTEIKVKFNGSPDESFPLVLDEAHTRGEWFGISMFCTRVGLKIDMNK